MTEQLTPETPAVEEEPLAETTQEAPLAEAPMAEAMDEAAIAETTEEAPIVGDEPVDAAQEAVTAETEPPPGAEPTAAATEDATGERATGAEPIAVAEAQPEPEPERSPRRDRQRDAAPVGVPASERPAGPRGLELKYRSDVVPALVKQFEYANPNQVPRLEKIVINVGMGEALTNAKAIDAASGDLTTITGQRPIVMKARRSIAQFKIRTGNPIGLKVTLRGQRMWDFLERLTLLTLPRIRDFRGTPSRSFDGRGNYTLGLREQIAFPEIDYDKVDRLRGLEVSIVTTAKSDEESKRLLELLGMPFAS